MNHARVSSVVGDVKAGLVVFLVALPLCLGIALASNAPLMSGLVSGIIGGLVVALISASSTSVSGPAAGLAAVVVSQIAVLGSFERFLTAVVLAGGMQIIIGLVRGGNIAAFFPVSVIKGLLTAIGILLIIKQVPHLVGHHADPQGDMAFWQLDNENSFSELLCSPSHLHWGATLIGLVSLLILAYGGRSRLLAKLGLPLPLIVVGFGIAINGVLQYLGWDIDNSEAQLVSVPLFTSLKELPAALSYPDFSNFLTDSKIWFAALTIGLVASLETLLNLEAVDKIDPKQRISPPNRELIAQGIGNMAAGFLGGLPITSVIVRGSTNINAGAKTKLSAFMHGIFLLLSVAVFAPWINLIPLSCLAAILLMTGLKLVDPGQIRRILTSRKDQAVPFAVTVLAIIFTDLLIGVSLGLVCAVLSILRANYRRPFRPHLETHLATDLTRLELPFHMTFLGRASLIKEFQNLKPGSHVLLDATATESIDSDILDIIEDLKTVSGPLRNIHVSLQGFNKFSESLDARCFDDMSTRELQIKLSPHDVLDILKRGNDRFAAGKRIPRILNAQVGRCSQGQYPLAVVLNCIDSRNAAEIVFDTGIGELFSVRIAGNVTSPKIVGSIEYCVGAAGAKLIVVMGHNLCGAVTAAVDAHRNGGLADHLQRCTHLPGVLGAIQSSLSMGAPFPEPVDAATELEYTNEMSRRNVIQSMAELYSHSSVIHDMVDNGSVMLVGAMYDVTTGKVRFFEQNFSALFAESHAILAAVHRTQPTADTALHA